MGKLCRSCGMESADSAVVCEFCQAPFAVAQGPVQAGKRPAPIGGPGLSPTAAARISEIEAKRKTRERVWVPVLSVVAVCLVAAIVFVALSVRTEKKPTGPDDSSPLMGAKCYFRALKRGDWAAVHATFAQSVAQKVSLAMLQAAVANALQTGARFARPIDDFTASDQGETQSGQVTMAFVSVECSPGPQTVFLVDEGGHWKVVWCPIFEDPPFSTDAPVP